MKWLSLRIDNDHGQKLTARLEYPYDEPRGFVLFAHCFSASKDSTAATRISQALVAHGFGVLQFDFTGLNDAKGDLTPEPPSPNVENLVAMANTLRKDYQAPTLLIGHSLGGTAILAAAKHISEAQAVVTIGAPSDPTQITRLSQKDLEVVHKQGQAKIRLAAHDLTITRALLDDIAAPAIRNHLQKLDRALLILHSPQDKFVPIDEARKLFEAARHPKSFVSLDTADHLLSHETDSTYVAATIAAWASRYLPTPTIQERPEGLVEVSTRTGKFAQTIATRHHRWVGDEPRSAGGDDLGPNPYDYLLAALGTCTSMTLQMYARRKGWPLDSVQVQLRHERIHAKDCEDCEKKEGFIEKITKQIRMEGPLDKAQKARLLEIADRCPVHRTLQGPPKIVTRESD